MDKNNNKKIWTVKISWWAEYAKVADRLAEFIADNKNYTIESNSDIKELWDHFYVLFKIKIIPDYTKPERFVNWQALLNLNANWKKSFEKCETIAVGRALAFLWYQSDWNIASFEEIENLETQNYSDWFENIK